MNLRCPQAAVTFLFPQTSAFDVLPPKDHVRQGTLLGSCYVVNPLVHHRAEVVCKDSTSTLNKATSVFHLSQGKATVDTSSEAASKAEQSFAQQHCCSQACSSLDPSPRWLVGD